MTIATRTLIVELNEFNVSLLQKASKQFGLHNIASVLDWHRGETIADHDREHNGLDPWCQWVSVHTEVPSSEHGIIRLGDVDKLKHTQIWERLGKQGITTGVWGVMNARRNNAALNQFFTTDPWNFTETPHPANLSDFFALPVYYSKNYMDMSTGDSICALFKTAIAILRHIPITILIKDGLFSLRQALGAKLNTCFLFAAFELVSTRLFVKLRKASDPQASFIFLNLVAHFQHHDWTDVDKIDRGSRAVFAFLDRILGLLLNETPGRQRIVVLNSFTQRNVSADQFYCYRQINPLKFLQRIGLNPVRVEQCMTNDGHAFFSSAGECEAAAELLRNACVESEQAFVVEIDPRQSTRLFYQFAYWGPANANTKLIFGSKRIPLFAEFDLHAKRTGAHVPVGDVFFKDVALPASSPNYEVFRNIWPRSADMSQ